MKAKLPWILLTLVVAFAASYAVGLLRAPAGGRLSESEQVELVARKIGLDARQRAEYVRFRKEMAAQESQRMQAQIDRLKAMRERMLNPDAAHGGADAIGDATAQSQRESMRANAARLREFMGQLRLEQREKFFELLVQSQTERLDRWKQTAE